MGSLHRKDGKNMIATIIMDAGFFMIGYAIASTFLKEDEEISFAMKIFVAIILIAAGLLLQNYSENNDNKISNVIIAEYPDAEVVSEEKTKNNGYIKFADGSIYTYKYENSVVIVKDINNDDVKNIIPVQE